jgi:Domain of unknown function DUF11
MAGIKDQENIDELRKRLYERGSTSELSARHQLTPRPVVEVSRGWDMPSANLTQSPSVVSPTSVPAPDMVPAQDYVLATADASQEVVKAPTKRRYRRFVLIVSTIFFLITATLSSLYLFFGANQISATNVSVSLSTEFSIAAGETLPIQISITNQNTVAIESATLIINYPPGTRASEENGKDLYEERIALETITPGQAKNIPLKVVLYGEENDSKEIKASVEYRIGGSNGTFIKEALPQSVIISSSPLVLRATGVDKISSGQELEVKLQLKSNSSLVQRNILVSASYPNSFSFIKSEPEAVYSDNSWLIKELKPEETFDITMRGKIAGLSNEISEIQLKAGNPKLENQFMMGAILAQSKFNYTIENPFTVVGVRINGDGDGEAILAPNTEAEVLVNITNTLPESIYDLRVELKPRGNLIREGLLDVKDEDYDSESKNIIYSFAKDDALEEMKSNETKQFSFRVRPDTRQTTASFNVTAEIYARKVNEAEGTETLMGSAIAEAKYSSVASLGSQIGYSDGPFTDSGPVPPVVDTATTYTVTLVAGAGVNDMAGAVVTTSLPQYMTWLEKTEGSGQIEYNQISKQIRWIVGEVAAQQNKTIKFQVSLLPTTTQVGRTALVIGPQELRANDSFTGVSLRANNPALSNELSTELGFVKDNGEIQSR